MLTESVAESAREANSVQMTQTTSTRVSPATGQLIRVVGHDIRNKLGVLKNSIYYLNMRLGHGDEKVQKHLGIMEREVANANRMISDLMDFALIKQPALQQSDIRMIIAEAIAQSSLPDVWETAFSLDDDLPAIMADSSQLQRAFTNIMLRIVEGVPAGGELQISARVPEGFLEVGFGTMGLLIPEENLAGAAAPLALAGGTSLGMAVSKIIVEGHGGTIEAERLGKTGTVLLVRLPLYREGGAEHEREGQDSYS